MLAETLLKEMKQNREEGKLETAKKMLSKNMSFQEIFDITGIDEQQLKNLKS